LIRSVFKAAFFQKYLLPGFVFQSVVIGGGYGTGRELVEFFMPYGPLGGLLAMVLVSAVTWSVVCAVTFAFARVFEAYDYRTFFKHLLGRGWVLYEVLYFIFLILILGVIAAAAGAILEETFDVPYAIGVVGMMALVGFLTFRGTALIEGFLARWSFVLYAVYIIFVIWAFSRFGGAIVSSFSIENLGLRWITGGVRYAAYNLAVIPPILFCVRHIEKKEEAVIAGLLAGPIAMTPALLFYISMLGQYPQIVDQPVPANYMLDVFGSRTFQVFFQVVLFGTLIETGTGMIHGLNERIAGVYEEMRKQMPSFLRPVVAIGLLIVGALLARFGIISLIAKGYGTITWFFLAVFVIPILTIGIWKLVVRKQVGLSEMGRPSTE
jgi:uncharacterized membrane protein YkvI